MNDSPARFDELVPDRIHPNAKGAQEIIMPTLIKQLGLMNACAFSQGARPEAGSCPGGTTALAQRNKTTLMADDAEGAKALAALDVGPATSKRIWMQSWWNTAQPLSWKVSSPVEADYELELVSSGISSVCMAGGVNGEITIDIKDGNWARNTLGVIRLKKGESTLVLRLPRNQARGGMVRSLDLLPVAARADYQKRVATMRSDAAWMRGAGYGVMLQYGSWAYPDHGWKKAWEEVVNAFDTEKFAKMVDEEMGARWVI